MQVSFLVIVIGFIAILGFIIHGFWCGRQERSPLIRDEQAERNANSMHPTTDLGTSEGKVTIIDNDFADEDLPNVINGNNDTMYINAEKNVEKQEEKDNSDSVNASNEQAIENPSIWSKIKNLFGNSAQKSEKESTEADTIQDPEDNYQIRINSTMGRPFAARDIVQLCEKYKLEHGKNNLYYHMNDGKEVFRLCGGEEPYVFDLDNLDTLTFSSLILILVLPDRGLAEDSYLRMAQFAYRLSLDLEGTMIDAHKNALNESKITEIRKILSAYDKLA